MNAVVQQKAADTTSSSSNTTDTTKQQHFLLESNGPPVVYDPLGHVGGTGAAGENVTNNVARSCFACRSNIRWVLFAQSCTTTLTHTTLDSSSSSKKAGACGDVFVV